MAGREVPRIAEQLHPNGALRGVTARHRQSIRGPAHQCLRSVRRHVPQLEREGGVLTLHAVREREARKPEQGEPTGRNLPRSIDRAGVDEARGFGQALIHVGEGIGGRSIGRVRVR